MSLDMVSATLFTVAFLITLASVLAGSTDWIAAWFAFSTAALAWRIALGH